MYAVDVRSKTSSNLVLTDTVSATHEGGSSSSHIADQRKQERLYSSDGERGTALPVLGEWRNSLCKVDPDTEGLGHLCSSNSEYGNDRAVLKRKEDQSGDCDPDRREKSPISAICESGRVMQVE